jgi:hypothetical protein
MELCCMENAGKKLILMGCRGFLLCQMEAFTPQAQGNALLDGPMMIRDQSTRVLQAGPLVQYHTLSQTRIFVFNITSTIQYHLGSS